MIDDRATIPYESLRDLATDGAVLLFRGRGIFSRGIQAASRTPYSHAALLVWWHFRLVVLEAREGKGVRAIPLSSVLTDGHDVELWDAMPHVQLDRGAALGEALAWLGSAYGWRSILRIGLGRVLLPLALVPFVGALVKRCTRPLRDSRGRPSAGIVCSELVARAWEAGGVELVRNLPSWEDAVIEPGDLPRGGAIRFLGRLTPPAAALPS